MQLNQFRSLVKRFVPKNAVYELQTFFGLHKLLRARKIFDASAKEPAWLGPEMLDSLQQKYPFPPNYGYDQESLGQRGKDRAGAILRLINPNKNEINTFLELGCWDGMVSCILRRKGKTATAIDNRSEGFDARAVREGVRFMNMDAACLEFGDESFDFVFSFDAFEHFARPATVLQEASRVTKKGGFIYLLFGPLYMSPKGLHAYRSVTIPYCQFLFQKEMLKEFTQVNGLQPIDFDQLNGWSLEEFHQLWNRCPHTLKRIKYYERLDLSGLDLVMKYPSCFKSKTENFDNLVVSSIAVLFEKIK